MYSTTLNVLLLLLQVLLCCCCVVAVALLRNNALNVVKQNSHGALQERMRSGWTPLWLAHSQRPWKNCCKPRYNHDALADAKMCFFNVRRLQGQNSVDGKAGKCFEFQQNNHPEDLESGG